MAVATPISIGDLEPLDSYEPRRLDVLRSVQEHKRTRRVMLAADVSLLFESRRSVTAQIQEMIRMEGSDEAAVAAVFDEYGPLVPTPERWTATLFVEVANPGDIKARLRHYAGLEHAVWLDAGGAAVPGRVMGDHGTEDATTAVTYLAFDVAGATPPPAAVVVAHPNLDVRIPIPPAVRATPA